MCIYTSTTAASSFHPEYLVAEEMLSFFLNEKKFHYLSAINILVQVHASTYKLYNEI